MLLTFLTTVMTTVSRKLNTGLQQFTLSSSPEKIEKWQYILLGLLLFFACFYGLSFYPILDLNEGLYAEIAREMVSNGHWVIPHLNGVPYLEKPPLLYWLIATSQYFFGINAFSARLIPSIFLALTSLTVLFVGKKLTATRTGWIASMILLSSLVFVIIGRVVFFDMILTFWVSISLLAFYFWSQAYPSNADQKNHYLSISMVGLGLSVLTKGLLALILLPLIMLIFLLVIRADKSCYIALLNKKALIILGMIILPWHVMGMLSLPEFTWEYFINNQLLRFFNARLPHDYHTGPFYFYIPRVIAYLLPWSIFLPAVIYSALRVNTQSVQISQGTQDLPYKNFNVFLWTWFLVMWLFFSLSGNKGDYYMVIGMVPLAYLIAETIEKYFVNHQPFWINTAFYSITSLLIIAGVISLVFYANHTHVASYANYAQQFSGEKIPSILINSISVLILSLMIYGLIGFYITRKTHQPMIGFLLITGLMIPLVVFYLTFRERTAFMYSQVSLVNYVQSQYEHRPVYFYQDFEAISSFVFYNQETSTIVDSKSADLFFGSRLQPFKNKFITLKDFIEISKNKTQPVYLVMKTSQFSAFEKNMGKNNIFCIVQRNGNVLLFSNATEDCRAVIDVGEKKDTGLDNLGLKKNA